MIRNNNQDNHRRPMPNDGAFLLEAKGARDMPLISIANQLDGITDRLGSAQISAFCWCWYSAAVSVILSAE
jgi:hypothetical protein